MIFDSILPYDSLEIGFIISCILCIILTSIMIKSYKIKRSNTVKFKEPTNFEYSEINELKTYISKDIDHLKESINNLKRDAVDPIQKILITTEQLQSDTKAIYGMQQNPSRQGKRVELDLGIIFKESGLIEGLHYHVQQKTVQGIPDYIITISKGHSIIVDSKAPTSSLLKSFETDDKKESDLFMKNFITNVKTNITELSKKQYEKIKDSTIDYTIMVLPEYALLPAIYTEPNITIFAIERHVILATPSILFILLHDMLLTHKEQELEQNIKNIISKYINLHERLDEFSIKYNKLGKNITDVISTYNKCIEQFNKDIRPLISDISTSISTNNTSIEDLDVIHKTTNRMPS